MKSAPRTFALVLVAACTSRLLELIGPAEIILCFIGATFWLSICEHSPSEAPIAIKDQIDESMGEGLELVSRLSAKVEPRRLANGCWEVSGGGPPPDWTERANEYFRRATEIFSPQPWLLKEFEAGYKGRVRNGTSDPGTPEAYLEDDPRSPMEKMLAFANSERSKPRIVVEACLDGLTEARRAVPA